MRDILPVALTAFGAMVLIALILPAVLPMNVQTWEVEKRMWLGFLVIALTGVVLGWNRRGRRIVSQNPISD